MKYEFIIVDLKNKIHRLQCDDFSLKVIKEMDHIIQESKNDNAKNKNM